MGTDMAAQEQEKLVSIYTTEDARTRGKPAYLAVLQLLHAKGASGAIALRGIAGFSSHSPIHTTGVVALSVGLPVKIEWVGNAKQVEGLLPELSPLVREGLITVQDVSVIKRTVPAKEGVLSHPVSSLMMTDVVAVEPATPLADAVSLLLRRGYRSLPVVDANRRVVGIVTDGDLLRNTSLPIRLGLQSALTKEQVQSDFDTLQASGRTVGEIMTMPVVTIPVDASIRQAGAVMVEHDLKRLPVVDADNRLSGIISRVDILRAMSAVESPEPDDGHFAEGNTIADLMVRDAPQVVQTADLEIIVRALERGRQQRVVVLNANGRIVGLITDGDLLRRSMYGRDPGLLRRLRGIITGTEPVAFDLPTGDETASDLMTAPVISVGLNQSLSDALGLMLLHELKRLPVVDDDGHYLGVLGRASVLRALMPEDAAQNGAA